MVCVVFTGKSSCYHAPGHGQLVQIYGKALSKWSGGAEDDSRLNMNVRFNQCQVWGLF